jgi:hypothetical protein
MKEFVERADRQYGDADVKLARALEAVPKVAIADDFALRVMQRVPARPVRKRVLLPERSRVGRRVMIAAMVAMAALMLGLAPWAWGLGHLALTAVEWVLCVEFIGLALWLSPVPRLLER